MKKQKLKLSDIEVDSFITTSEKEAETVNGGNYGNIVITIVEQTVSYAPGLGAACLIYSAAQATETIGEITASIIKSQQQMNCAGATRAIAGCTNGTWPCDAACI